MALLAILGIAAGLLLIGHYGPSAVGGALAVAGWRGLAALTLFQLLPLALCGLAWRALLRPPPAGAAQFFRFRLVRGAGALLPPAGQILGIRAMQLSGAGLTLAIASTVVDITIEMSAQLLFTLVGLVILVVAGTGGVTIGWAVAGLIGLVVPLAGLAFIQRARPVRLLATHPALSRFPLARLAGVRDSIDAIYADRACLRRGFALHLVAWFVGVGEAGVALFLLGRPLDPFSLVAIESVSGALRAAAFFVPGAAGVQEGGYVLLGALFGLPPETALSLSLLKRGRELVLTGLGFVVWQAAETAGRARLEQHLR